MSKWKNACDAYYWVYEHPNLIYDDYINPNIEITPHMVNPCLGENGQIDIECPDNNIRMQFWVECGGYINDENFGIMLSHDWELDCGGWTWDEAVKNLAELVLKKYGDYDND